MAIKTFDVPDPFIQLQRPIVRCRKRPDILRDAPFRLAFGRNAPTDKDPPFAFTGLIDQELLYEGIDDEGHQVAALDVLRFNLSGKVDGLGAIEISIDPRKGGGGQVRSLKPGVKFPAVHSTLVNVVATVDRNPDAVLQNAGPPVEIVSDPLETFPPEKPVVYKLKSAVPLAARGKREIVATISAGSALMEGLGKY